MNAETSSPVADKQITLAIITRVTCDKELLGWPANKAVLTDELNERITEALQHSSLMDAKQVHFEIRETTSKVVPAPGVYLCLSQVPVEIGFEVRVSLESLCMSPETGMTEALRSAAAGIVKRQPNARVGYYDIWLEDDLGNMLEDSFEHAIL